MDSIIYSFICSSEMPRGYVGSGIAKHSHDHESVIVTPLHDLVDYSDSQYILCILTIVYLRCSCTYIWAVEFSACNLFEPPRETCPSSHWAASGKTPLKCRHCHLLVRISYRCLLCRPYKSMSMDLFVVVAWSLIIQYLLYVAPFELSLEDFP